MVYIQHLICFFLQTTNQFSLDVCGGILSPLETLAACCFWNSSTLKKDRCTLVHKSNWQCMWLKYDIKKSWLLLWCKVVTQAKLSIDYYGHLKFLFPKNETCVDECMFNSKENIESHQIEGPQTNTLRFRTCIWLRGIYIYIYNFFYIYSFHISLWAELTYEEKISLNWILMNT